MPPKLICHDARKPVPRRAALTGQMPESPPVKPLMLPAVGARKEVSEGAGLMPAARTYRAWTTGANINVLTFVTYCRPSCYDITRD